MSADIQCNFLFDESSLNSSATSCRTWSQSPTITADDCSQEADAQGSYDGGVALQASPVASPAELPPEQVNVEVKIIKTVDLKVNPNWTVESFKALIQFEEKIHEHSLQLFFEGNLLEDRKRLADYGIDGHATIHVILQDLARVTVNVQISSIQKNFLVEARNRDTILEFKLMICDRQGISLDEFDLAFGGKVLAEHQTLASLNLPPKPTFHLVLHPNDHVSVIVEMSGRGVIVDAKFWYTVGDVKAMAAAMMSAQDMSLRMAYQGKQLEDHKTLASDNIADGFVLQLVSPEAPFRIFV